jgi:hypothetical protein|tara:strand:+ start:4444 stop:4860 length:417 start_codon:yes stop_codon:yes gene_type:complete
MIELIKMVDGVARAYSTAAFRAENSRTVYGASISSRHLAAQDVYRVRAGVKPAEAVGFKIVQEPFPVLVDGVWVHGYVSVALDADEARDARNAMLKASDWMAVTDRTMTGPETAYRKSLRDVPQQAGFPKTTNWPTKP